MSRLSPLAAVCAGVAAGFVGCLAQDLFFAWTRRAAPSAGADDFKLPELEQAEEVATQTVARRVVEDLVQRGPVQNKARAGRVVHYAFGSAWGGLYGILAGTFPNAVTLKGGVVFGLAVWAVSDDLLLPWFKLSAWPHRYPVKTHLYAMAAHAAYGAAVSTSFFALQRNATPAAALLGSLYLTRRVPRPLRPTARRLTHRALRVLIPARRIGMALNGAPPRALI